MAKVDLKGVATAKAKGKTYHYAWRGGPRLLGEPGTPEFVASYVEAHEARRAPDPTRFRALVVAYKGSRDYLKLAESTRRNWGPWLDRLSNYFGDLRVVQFDRPEKIRPIIRKWRKGYEATPRTADLGMQVLSRVLSYAVEDGRIGINPCEGIKHLYTVDRAQIIWTDADIAALKKTCSREIAYAVDLAAATGLRQGDLLRLSWSHVGADSIVIATGKSGHRRQAIIPMYDELIELLARIPKRATTVLTNGRGKPWTANGFKASFNKAKAKAGLDQSDDAGLRFHDLRGTAATRFYNIRPPIEMRVIAEILGWEEASVERIIRRYVDRAAATKALVLQINEAKRIKGGT